MNSNRNTFIYRNFSIVFALFFAFNLSAQTIEVDYYQNQILKNTKSFDKLSEIDKLLFTPEIFLFTLTYSDHISTYLNHDFSKLFDNSIPKETISATAEKNDGETVNYNIAQTLSPDFYKGFERKFYKDYSNKKLYAELYSKQNFQIEDAFFNWNWTITDEEKMILGYKCKKAISTHLGPKFEAWFTDEIPFPIGPDQFDGLPGLILYLSTGNAEIVAKSVRVNQESKSLEIPKFSGKVYTFGELYKK